MQQILNTTRTLTAELKSVAGVVSYGAPSNCASFDSRAKAIIVGNTYSTHYASHAHITPLNCAASSIYTLHLV